MNEQTKAKTSNDENLVLTAVQLGWLVVETYGRLNRYERAKRKPSRPEADPNRRFAFSDNELQSLDELSWNISQLHNKLTKLDLDLPPAPLPPIDELEQQLDDGLDVDILHEAVDNWSKQVWGRLNVEDGIIGRAFVFGGSLADTYWNAYILKFEDKAVEELLNEYRLGNIVARANRFASALPAYSASVLQHSLRKWSKMKVDSFNKDRLEKQQEVWRDLLFERRAAESYLQKDDYIVIKTVSTAVQITLALALIILVGIGGWNVGNILEDTTNDWSAFLAAVSSLLVVIGGLVSRISLWVKLSGDFVGERLKLQLILIRTLRE